MENSRKLTGRILVVATIFTGLMISELQSEESQLSAPIICEQRKIEMLDQLKEKLDTAQENIRARNFDLSIQTSKEGIEILGKKYLSDGVIDDTGMKYTLATIEEKQNNIEVASTLYSKVLESRINLLQIKLVNTE